MQTECHSKCNTFANIFFDHYHQDFIDLVDELVQENSADKNVMLDMIDIIIDNAHIKCVDVISNDSEDSDDQD